mmetsp:Transcript_21971/g.39185  ORF Transcript_21971/g.39185 Transcript_21971/m.39185 type:complete len:198 (+) Transcript_21971:119-712(+)
MAPRDETKALLITKSFGAADNSDCVASASTAVVHKPASVKDAVPVARPRPHRVSFHDELHIAEYPIEIGDNPGCSCGAPITIGWTPIASYRTSLEEFDTSRHGLRRHKKELAIPAAVREDRLRNEGYTTTEIRKANVARAMSRQQRRQTVDNLELDDSLLLLKKVVWKLPKQGFRRLRNVVVRDKTHQQAETKRQFH